jgi:hypothetical protein
MLPAQHLVRAPGLKSAFTIGFSHLPRPSCAGATEYRDSRGARFAHRVE